MTEYACRLACNISKTADDGVRQYGPLMAILAILASFLTFE